MGPGMPPMPPMGMGYGMPPAYPAPPSGVMHGMVPAGAELQAAFPAYQEEYLPSQAPGSPQSAKPHYIFPDEDLSMVRKATILLLPPSL